MPLQCKYVSLIFAILAAGAFCEGCTRAELVDKADAYDAAVWDSNNRKVLLNAVRASQRAPMSFVAIGDVTATPTLSGTTGGTISLGPGGLTSYGGAPSFSYGGGFSSFQLANLNQNEFFQLMHAPIQKKEVDEFFLEKWPKELVTLILTQSITLTPGENADIDRQYHAVCATPATRRDQEICDVIQQNEDDQRSCEDPDSPELEVLNTARDFCSMNKFQILTRKLRLLNEPYPRPKYRSPEGILYYLGELTAAQLYSTHRYDPKILIETADGVRREIPLFVVKRGNPGPPTAAVQVKFNGEEFYIPRPELGDLQEARSLQVLDIATTAITLATTKASLPKSNNVNLVTAKSG
jgi:hypothetical protein